MNQSGKGGIALLILVALAALLFYANPTEEIHKEQFYKECKLYKGALLVNSLKLKDKVKSIFKYNDYFLFSILAIRSEIVKKDNDTRKFQPVSVGLLHKILVIKDEEWFKELNVI